MSFLTKDELKTVKVPAVINLITNSDDDTVSEVIKDAISVMKDHLRNHYDADAVFNAEGENRSRTVLKYLKHLVVFDLFGIRSTEAPPMVEKMYNEAMTWLDKVEKGKSNPKLPKYEDPETGEDKPFLSVGSRKKYPTSF